MRLNRVVDVAFVVSVDQCQSPTSRLDSTVVQFWPKAPCMHANTHTHTQNHVVTRFKRHSLYLHAIQTNQLQFDGIELQLSSYMQMSSLSGELEFAAWRPPIKVGSCEQHSLKILCNSTRIVVIVVAVRSSGFRSNWQQSQLTAHCCLQSSLAIYTQAMQCFRLIFASKTYINWHAHTHTHTHTIQFIRFKM